MNIPNFTAGLLEEVLKNVYNYYDNNYDEWRFGALPWQRRCTARAKRRLIFWFRVLGLYFVEKEHQNTEAALSKIEGHLKGLENTWKLLADNESKKLLTQIFAYRILGKMRYKLPLSNKAYWENLEKARRMVDEKKCISIDFMNWHLKKTDLKDLGYNIQMFYTPSGILTKFLIKQYEYKSDSRIIKAEKGDYVIDAGACYGDMTLRFACEVGEQGKIFASEFIPSNLEILKKNVGLNPDLESRIEYIEHPLWSVSGKQLSYRDEGPASKVSDGNEVGTAGRAETISIDDFVKEKQVSRLDFIKMDIEGAELEALKGAEGSIKRFRPKLAISVYHKLEDFHQIPEYLNALGMGYKFFLGHYTIYSEETVLYAAI